MLKSAWVVAQSDQDDPNQVFVLYVQDEEKGIYGEVGSEVPVEVAKGIAREVDVSYNAVAYPNVFEAKKYVESLLK